MVRANLRSHYTLISAEFSDNPSCIVTLTLRPSLSSAGARAGVIDKLEAEKRYKTSKSKKLFIIKYKKYKIFTIVKQQGDKLWILESSSSIKISRALKAGHLSFKSDEKI